MGKTLGDVEIVLVSPSGADKVRLALANLA